MASPIDRSGNRAKFDPHKPILGAMRGQRIEDLTARLQVLKNLENEPAYERLQKTAAHFKDEIPCSSRVTAVAIIALVIVGIVVFFLFASNHLFSFPQDFLNFIHNINYTHLAIGCGVTLVLCTGAGVVIYRAANGQEELLKVEGKEAPERGTIQNVEDFLETVYLKETKAEFVFNKKTQKFEKKYVEIEGYIDKSTLDETDSGKAYVYHVKDCANHYTVSTIVPFLGTPFYIIGAIAFNIIRMVVIPAYILIMCLVEACTGKAAYPDERKFSPLDAGAEFLRSVHGIIKAPFHGLAYFFAALYSYMNWGGRKLGAAIERDWNDGANIAEGLWVVEPQRLWNKQGAFGPEGIYRKRYFLAGCWQPYAVVEYENGQIKEVYWLEKAVIGKGANFDAGIRTRSDLEAEIYPQLYEYQDIEAELSKRQKN